MSDARIYLRDGPILNDIGIVNLHPEKGKHGVAYINENYSKSYRFTLPQKLSNIIIKRNGHCFLSENKIQDLTSKKEFFVVLFLFKLYLTTLIGIDFNSAVLNLYYHRCSSNK